MNIKATFIGGCVDGTRKVVDDSQDYWIVPVYPDPVLELHRNGYLPPKKDCSFKIHKYTKETFRVGRRHSSLYDEFKLYVFEDMTPSEAFSELLKYYGRKNEYE